MDAIQHPTPRRRAPRPQQGLRHSLELGRGWLVHEPVDGLQEQPQHGVTQRCQKKEGSSQEGQLSRVTSPGRRLGNDRRVRKKPNLVLIPPNAALLCHLTHPGEGRLLQCCCVSRASCRWRSGAASLPCLGWCLEVSDHPPRWRCTGSDPLLGGETLSWTCCFW